MKIVHLIPGSGENFYCENCTRDGVLPSGLRRLGHEAIVAPMYLPSDQGVPSGPIFYGAVGMYLRETFPVMRSAPKWVSRVLDTKPLLKLAGRLSGATQAGKLADLTTSMLAGESGRQGEELSQLIRWLRDKRPDVVHLSNGLLLGVARRVKQELGIPVVCSLQDEHTWIDQLDPEHRETIWNQMRSRIEDVDLLLPVSEYYRDFMAERLRVNGAKTRVVPVGVETDRVSQMHHQPEHRAIGFLSHISEAMGFGVLVDAFIELKQETRFRDLQLLATGGYSRNESSYISSVLARAKQAGCQDQIDIIPAFSQDDRLEFLSRCTVLSVPAQIVEAIGTFQLEAMASSVPVIMPDSGGFSEIVNNTGGGVLYTPNTPHILAATLAEVLDDPERIRQLGEAGKRSVTMKYSLKRMVNEMAEALESVCALRR